ncbi:MAG: sugar-transfer associated ATP-grasp domain-containing protein [Eubacterium sp.]
MGVKRTLKKNLVSFLAFKDVSNGFSVKGARKWTRQVLRSYFKDSNYSYKETRWAVKRGFLPSQVAGLELNESNYRDTVSAKDYAFLRPLNGVYYKWIADRVTINEVFKPYRDKMPKCYYHIIKRNNDSFIIPMLDPDAGDTFDDVLGLIKDKGKVRICYARRKNNSLVEWKDDKLFLDGKELPAHILKRLIDGCRRPLVIMEDVESAEDFKGGELNLVVFNSQGDNPVIGDAYIKFTQSNSKSMPVFSKAMEELEEELDDIAQAQAEAENEDDNSVDISEGDDNDSEENDSSAIYANVDIASGKISDAVSIIEDRKVPQQKNPNNDSDFPEFVPYWDEIKATIDSMCRFAPQLEFFGLNIVICRDGFKIVWILNHPMYPKVVPFSKETSDYLKYKVAQKKEAYKGIGTKLSRGAHKLSRKIRSIYAKLLFPKGLLPYLAVKFPKEQLKDFFTNKDTSLKEKLWAFKHGFISYRIHQYGITDENYHNFISDFEYRWLRHINPKYKEWMEDKITVKYICSDYNEFFPEYYYHISLKNGNNKVVSMMDCPEGYSNTYDDIFRLVKEKGSLALKPDEGSHGDGFYKFSYDDGKYYLNHEEAQAQDVLNILQDVNNQYLITEYIDMHPVIKNIYSGSVNTIRMLVFKRDGKTPEIGNAYMRFGSKRTGAVDNMGAGGMFAKIDIDTGRFYDAKIIEANEIKPCLYHPDTNVKIEGYLPNWEKVKADVLRVAKSIPQLEYFGFDLALTSEGLKFPEINRFPDYPAIEKLSPQTMDYLLYKLEQKKLSYGSKDFRGSRLVKLPKR